MYKCDINPNISDINSCHVVLDGYLCIEKMNVFFIDLWLDVQEVVVSCLFNYLACVAVVQVPLLHI